MNLENMNILIDAIEKSAPAQCVMERWVSHRSDGECGSAYCIAGWVGHLVDEGALPDVPYQVSDWDESVYAAQMREVIGITPEDVDRLALMKGYMYANRIEQFDRLPPIVRKAAMLNVLKKFRDTGDVNWADAIEDAKASYDGY